MEINVRGLRIHYEQFGSPDRPHAVVVHGWGCSVQVVRPLCNLLKASFFVTAIDLPGHGQSDLPGEVFGTDDFADVLEDVFLALGLREFAYFGHSFGGKCGIELAARGFPTLSKLVLMDASGIRPPLSDAVQRKIAWRKRFRKIYAAFFGKRRADAWYSRFGSADYRAAEGIMRPILVRVVQEDLSDRLSKIAVPTLLIWGKNDLDTPLWMGEEMHTRIPHASLVVLDAGHYVFLDDPRGTREAIRSFLLD